MILAGLASQRRPPPGPVVVFDADGVVQVRVLAGFSTPGFAAPHDLERRLDALEAGATPKV